MCAGRGEGCEARSRRAMVPGMADSMSVEVDDTGEEREGE